MPLHSWMPGFSYGQEAMLRSSPAEIAEDIKHMQNNLHNVSSYKKALETFEKSWIEKTMEQYKGNQVRAAEALEISRGTLRIKLAKYFGDAYFRNTKNA